MNILIATDAWEPQVNGVVKTLKNTIKILEEMGHTVKLITPNDYWCFRLPFTKDIYSPYWVRSSTITEKIEWADYIHISTEGSIGWKVRNYCLKKGYKKCLKKAVKRPSACIKKARKKALKRP